MSITPEQLADMIGGIIDAKLAAITEPEQPAAKRSTRKAETTAKRSTRKAETTAKTDHVKAAREADYADTTPVVFRLRVPDTDDLVTVHAKVSNGAVRVTTGYGTDGSRPGKSVTLDTLRAIAASPAAMAKLEALEAQLAKVKSAAPAKGAAPAIEVL